MSNTLKRNKEQKIKVGQLWMISIDSKEMNYFTKGNKYEVKDLEWENGSCQFTVTLTDDEGDLHPFDEKRFRKHFVMCNIQK